MTNTLAIIFAVIIVAFLALDHFVLHWGMLLILGKKLVLLTEYIAFWR